MKIDTVYLKDKCMLVFIVSCLISCAASHTSVKSEKVFLPNMPVVSYVKAAPKKAVQPDTTKKDTTIKVVDSKSVVQPIEKKMDQTQDILKNLSLIVSAQNVTNSQVNQLVQLVTSQATTIDSLRAMAVVATKEKQEERSARIQEKRLREQQEDVNAALFSIVKNMPAFVGVLLIVTAALFYQLGRIAERRNLNISL